MSRRKRKNKKRTVPAPSKPTRQVEAAPSKKKFLLGVGLLLAVGAAALFILPRFTGKLGDSDTVPAAAGASARSSGEPPAENRPKVVHHGGYVGSKSCQECHAHEHATWHASYHRTMAQVATPATVIGDFNNVTLKFWDTTYRFYRQGEEFWVEMDAPDFEGDQAAAPRINKRIVQTTGSHHAQVYWYLTGQSRKLGLVPLLWRIDMQRWIPLEAEFLMPPSQRQKTTGGRWNTGCSQCHATGLKPRVTAVGNRVKLDTHVAELGISCEACHGPAEEHIQVAEDAEDDADLKIVDPARLSARKSSQVCGQCHSANFFHNEGDHLNWLTDGFRYRPGGELTETRFVATRQELQKRGESLKWILSQYEHFVEDHFWSDGIIRLAGREYAGLIESPCYKHGDNSRTISCLSCHQLHQAEDDLRPLKEWADDLLKPGMRTNLACLQCHGEFRDKQKLVSHTRHSAGSSGSKCYNCHMPFTSYGLLKAIRSHTIASPSVQSSLETGRPNGCNLCHLDKTRDWTAGHLQKWYRIEKPEMGDDERQIAASVLWALKGDAGQRALVAWSMGWPPAREASGSDWLTPYLSQLMADNYAAVRFIAYRSLRRQEDFQHFKFDFVAPRAERARAAVQVYHRWAARPGNKKRTTGEEVLIGDGGEINRTVYDRLLRERNKRRVYLNE